ncbi:MAG: phosphoethanolamine transferase [Paludibacteraceae bacterium]|nr:phosphoethanolamine transferase [Paludibacteraceae bacterium]
MKNIEKLFDVLYKNRFTLVILSLLGILGSIDAIFSSGNNIALEFARWYLISFVFAAILTILIGIHCKITKIIGFTIAITYSLLCVINATGFLFWGFGISCRMLSIIFETNSREAIEFFFQTMENLASLNFLLCLIVAIGTTFTLLFLINQLKESYFKIIITVLALAGCLFTGLQLNDTTEKKNTNIFLRTALDLKHTTDSFREYEYLNSITSQNLPYPETLVSNDTIDNIIIVIGESASRNHHSVYNYTLPTTPRLKKKEDKLLFFNDAISAFSTTSESMKMFMTFVNSTTNTNEWYNYPDILSIFSKAGYKTYWLSNQEKNGFMGGCESYFAQKCDKSKFVGILYTGDNLQEKYDDSLLPELSSALKDSTKNKLIVLHLMGSHGEYHRRYPKEYTFFTYNDIAENDRPYLTDQKKKLIAEYDNSILYTDLIISNIIDSLCLYPHQKNLCIYFSDHGEEMYGKRDFAGHSIGYVDIPFIIWASDLFKSKLPDKYALIENSVNKPISLENFPDFLLGISSINYHYYNPTLDFSSKEYIYGDKRIADNMPYHKGQCE